MTYLWSQQSKNRMEGVHPDLIKVADRALSYGILDLTVLPDGGVRKPARQMELVKKGVSQTLKSKHLIQRDGYGHALDLAPFPVDWKDKEGFLVLATLMFKAAMELGVKIEWGGHWKNFQDSPHWQLLTERKIT